MSIIIIHECIYCLERRHSYFWYFNILMLILLHFKLDSGLYSCILMFLTFKPLAKEFSVLVTFLLWLSSGKDAHSLLKHLSSTESLIIYMRYLIPTPSATVCEHSDVCLLHPSRLIASLVLTHFKTDCTFLILRNLCFFFQFSSPSLQVSVCFCGSENSSAE